MEIQLPSDTTFLVDFNLHCVAAALGLDVPANAAAAIFNADAAALEAYRQTVQAQVSAVAQELLAHDETRAALQAWPLSAGQTVLFLGDSITTYLYSYARFLQEMIALQHGAGSVRVINGAQSGYTSTHGLEAAFTLFLAQKPDWVFIKFGVNDCKQFGGPQAKTLVSAEEYGANLRAMVVAFQEAGARVVLLTPTPVAQSVVNENPDFQAMRMTWANHTLEAFGRMVRDLAAAFNCTVVDLQPVFGRRPDPALYLDGLHPGPAGQQLILQAVLQALAS